MTQSAGGSSSNDVYKYPYYFITKKAFTIWENNSILLIHSDLSNMLHETSRGSRQLLYNRFKTKVVIGEFTSMGILEPTSVGSEQLTKELNQRACEHLRQRNIKPDDKIFIWLLDETTWNNAVMYDTSEYRSRQGYSSEENTGIIIKVTTAYDSINESKLPIYPSLFLHEFAHLFGARHSYDESDLMYKLVPIEPASFNDAYRVYANINKKSNLC